MDRSERFLTLNKFICRLGLVAIFFALPSLLWATPAALTYQGRIIKSDGTPLEYSAVSFIFQITDPSGACVLYQEHVSGYNMVNSKGVFDTPIGNGSVNFPLGGGFTVLDSFSNSIPLACGNCSGYVCSVGTSTYNPTVSDGRLLRVQFYDGTGWNTISPDSVIRSVPYAGHAQTADKLGSNVVSDFLLKAGLPTCGAGTYLTWNGSAMTCAAGTAAITSLTGDVTTAGTGAAAATVAKIQGSPVTLTAPTSGDYLRYNGSAFVNSPISTSDLSGTLAAATLPAFSGDVTSSAGSSVLTLSATGTAGTYYKVTTDSKGRVTSGSTSLLSADIPNLDWSKITTGTPTTLAGYGITDSVKNVGGVGNISAGLDASKPSAPATGDLFVATDSQKIYRYNGASWDVVSSAGGTGGTVTSVATGTGLSGGTITGTGTIAIANTTVTAASYGSATQVPTFTVNAQGQLTAAADVTISGVVPGGSAGGDLGGTYPNPTLAKISGTSLNITSLTAGDRLKYDGTNWVNSAIAIGDVTNLSTQLANKIDAGNMPANCGSGQTLTFSSPTGTWNCANILVSGANFASQSANVIFAGPTTGSAAPSFRTLVASDIPNLDWSKITTGTPTTLAGYAITDAVKNSGGVGNISAGLDASKPGAPATGDLFVATDSQKIYRYNGASWDVVSSAGGTGGTVTSVAAGTGLSGGTITGTGTLAIANTAVTAASYGSATQVPTFTVNAQGQLTAAANVTISGVAPGGSAGGDLGGTYPNPTLAKIGGTSLNITSLTAGDRLKYDGTNWVNSTIAIGDVTNLSTQLASKLDAANMPASCGASQTLTFSSPTGAWTCSNISVSGANFASQSANVIFAGPTTGSAAPSFRSLAASDIPNLDWSKITSGTPTTLAGYGITDSVKNVGGVGNMSAGLDASKPGTPATGDLFVATDSQKIYRYNGASWDVVSSAGGTGGTVTSVSAGTGLSGGTITGSGSIAISNTTVTAGAYGSTTQVPTFTVNAQGQLTAAGNVTISGVAPGGSAGGDLGGTYPNPTLAKISGTSLSISSLTAGDRLKYDGTNWVNSAIAIGDVTNLSTQLANKIDAGNMPANCGSGQTLTFSSPTGAWTCSNISVSGANFASQSANVIFAGPTTGSAAPSFRTLAASDIPNLDWSKITSGKPTTLAGYGVTDGLLNLGGTPGVQTGLDASKPAGPSAGTIYFATDTLKIYQYNSGAWSMIASAGGSGGSVTSVTSANADIGVATTTSTPVLTLNSGVGANQIVKLDGTAKLPAVDGSALTNLNASNLASGTVSTTVLPIVPITKGGTGVSSLAANRLLGTNGTGTAQQAVTCALNQVLSFDASGNYGCYSVSSIYSGFTNGGNSFGGTSSLGNIDNFDLNVITNNQTRMTVQAGGSVGIGITAPETTMHIYSAQPSATSQPSRAGLIVEGEGTSYGGRIASRVYSSSESPFFAGYRALGTKAAPTALTSGKGIATLVGYGYDGSGWSSNSSSPSISLETTEAWTGTNKGSRIVFTTTPNGNATTAERMRIDSTGYVGIGTTSPVIKLDVAGAVRVGADATACAAGVAGAIRYNSGNVEYCNGTAWTAFAASGAGITSLNGLTGATQTFATPGTSGTAPAWSSVGSAHTLNIPMANTATVTAGLISKTEFDTFNSKLGTATTFSGDMSGTYNATSVDKIKGTAVVPSGLAANQVLRYNGTNWVNGKVDVTTDLTGIIPVANGGTGASSLGAGNLLVGSGTSAVTSLAAGSAGNVVYATGVTTWASGSADTAGLVDKTSTQTISGAKAFTNSIQMNGQNPLRLADADSTNFIALRSPATVASDVTLTLPGTAGSSGQFLSTDGTGVLSWASMSAPSGAGYIYSVRAATTANITLSGTQTIDGVAVVAGDRVLVKNQTAGAENGVYVVAAGAWSRAADLDTWTEAVGYVVRVSQGTVYDGGALYYADAIPGGTLGTTALDWVTSASSSSGRTAFGFKALYSNTTGSDNTAVGTFSLMKNTMGLNNTAVGVGASQENSNGWYNVAVGAYSLNKSVTGDSNIAIGERALYNAVSTSESTAVGWYSMYYADNNPTSYATTYNTALGAYAMRGSSTAANNTGVKNTAIGHSALKGYTSGSNNIGLGYNAGSSITTGSNNVVIGSNTGASIATSSNNIIVSDGAGNIRLFADGTGNIGIGTTVPGSALDVKGEIRTTGTTSGYSGFRAPASGSNITYTLPGTAGSSNQVLTTDGAGGLSWSTPATTLSGDVSGTSSATSVDKIKGTSVVPSGLAANQVLRYNGTNWVNGKVDLTTDLTGVLPVANGGTGASTLGSGNLLVGSGTSAVSSLAAGSAGNVVYATGITSWASGTPDNAGLVDKTSTQTISGAKSFTNYIQMSAQNQLRLADSDSTNYVALRSPATVASNVTLTLPDTAGSNGQFLSTDGAGTLSWVTGGGSGDFLADGTVSMTGAFKASAGTVAAPSIAFSGDAATGLYSPSASTLGLAAGGVDVVRFGTTASAVNYLSIVPAATLFGPTITSAGSDTNIPININAKGTGNVNLRSSQMTLTASNMQLSTTPFVSQSGSNGSAYTSSSAAATTPTLGVSYTSTNSSATNSSGAYHKFRVTNSSSLTQDAYFGTVSNTGAAVYTPTIVLGQQTGATAYSERLRIDTAGNMGINNVAPAYKLDVTGDIQASGCLRSSAGVASGTCTSDERLKTDIRSFDLGLDALMGITPHLFKYNGLGGHPASKKLELGVIAQEVEKTAPQLIIKKQEKLHPEDNQTTEIKQVNYTAFTYVLINSVKELYSKILSVVAHQENQDRKIASIDANKVDRVETQILKAENAQLKKENVEIKARLERIEKMLQSK